jgi:hypothetical protein
MMPMDDMMLPSYDMMPSLDLAPQAVPVMSSNMGRAMRMPVRTISSGLTGNSGMMTTGMTMPINMGMRPQRCVFALSRQYAFSYFFL